MLCSSSMTWDSLSSILSILRSYCVEMSTRCRFGRVTWCEVYVHLADPRTQVEQGSSRSQATWGTKG